MLLWLNGLTGQNQTPPPPPPKTVIECLINLYSKMPLEIGKFLDEETFLNQLKSFDSKLLEFISKERKQFVLQMIQILIEPCVEVDDSNYKFFITYPMIVLDIMSLGVSPIINTFFEEAVGDELLDQIFSFIDRKEIFPEPQLYNLIRFITYIQERDTDKISMFIFKERIGDKPLIIKLLNHIYSAQITSFLISLFNPDSCSRLSVDDQQTLCKTKLEILKICIENFLKLNPTEVLNFMLLVHEIMTKFVTHDQLQIIMDYLISQDVIGRLFGVLKLNPNMQKKCILSLKLFVQVSRAHIIFDIQLLFLFNDEDEAISTNYEQQYHQQLTQQFESSDFMVAFQTNLYIIADLLAIQSKRLGVLTFKLIEITDNLIRISNLYLWKKMVELEFLQKIFVIYFKFPSSNIIQTLIEKMVLYILNRAVSDFHPFWASKLLFDYNLLSLLTSKLNEKQTSGPLIQLISHINNFKRELQENFNSNKALKYRQEQERLLNFFQSDQNWASCSKALQQFNKATEHYQEIETPVEEKIQNSDDSQRNRLFSQTKTNYHEGASLQTKGDDPISFDDNMEPQNEQQLINQIDNAQELISNILNDNRYKLNQTQENEIQPFMNKKTDFLPVANKLILDVDSINDNVENENEIQSTDKTTPKFSDMPGFETMELKDESQNIIKESLTSISLKDLEMEFNDVAIKDNSENISFLDEYTAAYKKLRELQSKYIDNISSILPQEKKENQSYISPNKDSHYKIMTKDNEHNRENQQQSDENQQLYKHVGDSILLDKSDSPKKSILDHIENQIRTKQVDQQINQENTNQNELESYPKNKIFENQEQNYPFKLEECQFTQSDQLGIEIAIPERTFQNINSPDGNRYQPDTHQNSSLKKANSRGSPQASFLDSRGKICYGEVKFNNLYSSFQQLPLPLELTPRRRESAMESSLKLKFLSEEPVQEFSIAQSKDEQNEKVLFQSGNRKILQVDEIDMERRDSVLNSSFQSVDLSSSICSVGSKKIKVVFRQSMQKPPQESQSINFQSLIDTSQNSMDTNLANSVSSVKSLDADQKKFRQVSNKDKEFLNFLKTIKKPQQIKPQELQ